MHCQEKYNLFLKNNLNPRQLICHDSSLLNFSSNDYLGLSQHPELIARSKQYTEQFGTGSRSSRLVTGNGLFTELEIKLAQALQKPAALILGTGYQTNFTVLEALLDEKILGKKPVVFCDRMIHASMITSVQQFAMVKRFKHNDLNHLEQLLQTHASQPMFILAESLYSMDGDYADLAGLIRLAKSYAALLYIDDAHSVGIDGQNGWGLAANYASDIDLIMGTFSKALGSFGGYIGCSLALKEYLVNRCRGLIYSTALPPPVLGAIAAVLELVPSLQVLRQRLKSHREKLLAFFRQNHLNCGTARSHIIPWIVGDAEQTLRASELLRKENILAVTIRPPTVPVGQSRIRLCLSAAHTDADIEQLIVAITKTASQL